MVNRSARTLWLRNIQPTFVVLARLVVGATFVFSGFVKSVDPMGTSLKIREYLSAFELDYIMPISLFLAMCIGVYELVLGVNTLFGSYRRVTSILLFLTMLVMTPLTLYLALADPISDCGCFGEAVYLTHWQSFSKNVVLLLLTVFLLRCNHRLRGVYHKEIQSLTVYFVVLFAVGMSLYAYYFQPVFAFRRGYLPPAGTAGSPVCRPGRRPAGHTAPSGGGAGLPRFPAGAGPSRKSHGHRRSSGGSCSGEKRCSPAPSPGSPPSPGRGGHPSTSPRPGTRSGPAAAAAGGRRRSFPRP